MYITVTVSETVTVLLVTYNRVLIKKILARSWLLPKILRKKSVVFNFYGLNIVPRSKKGNIM